MPSYRIPTVYERPPLQRRASSLTLALAINFLVLLALIGIGVRPDPVPVERSGVTRVELIAQSPEPAAEPEDAAAPQRREQPAETRPVPAAPPPRIALPTRPTITPDVKLDMIELTREDYAAADIARIPRASSGASAGDSEEVGRGPNGEVLYAAEWAREPTSAELGGYLPANWPEGWGLIACRTIAGNRVDDCVELGQSPRGSRLASAVRQAAWQFRVRPPRKNGRPMIGEWVQIRIDYIRSN